MNIDVTKKSIITSTRREFLRTASMLCAGVVFNPNQLFAEATDNLFDFNQERVLKLFNINTKDYLDVTYFKNGNYLDDAFSKINLIMADRRSGEVKEIDINLVETLHMIQKIADSSEPIDLICGYRSPTTNAKLTHLKRGIAKHSYHPLGQAADIKIQGISIIQMKRIAEALKAGGVGYYPHSNFIHVDTGPVRSWRG